MKREIKFRAWSGEKMYEPDYLSHGQSVSPACDDSPDKYYDDPIMQFTGLRDKNGKEIYEGDLLRQYTRIFLVKWDDRMAAFQAENIKDAVDVDFFNWLAASTYASLVTKDALAHQDANCEIIGNIYENPELLK